MKSRILSLLIFTAIFTCTTNTKAQVGIGTSSPNNSAQLEVNSASKGFLPPRVALTSTSAASNAISSPATGLLVYNTATAGTSPNNVTPGYYFYDGSKWQRLINQQPDATVSFNTTNPNPPNTPTFTPNTPQSSDFVYVGSDGSQWTWNGTAYVTYTPPASTPWMLSGGTNDAGSNKSSAIYRSGNVGIGTGTTAPVERLQLGTGFAFHDGGDKVLGLGVNPSNFTSLFNNQWPAEIRLDPSTGNLSFGTTSNSIAPITGVSITLARRMTIARSGNVGIGTTSPNASALLDLTSTTQGFLPPSMTSTQRNAITSPAAGLVVYNNTDHRLDIRQNTTWRSLATLDGTETLTNKTLTTPTIASGSSQWPSSLSITPTTHGTSKRASVWIDEWSLLQDIVGDGTKNFGIVQTVLGSPTTYPVRLFINTTGNMGLGTTSPTTALHIQNNNSIGAGNPASNTVPGIYLFNDNNASSTAHSILALRTGGSAGGKPYLSLDALNHVGYSIGLDNPNNRLLINSTWNFDMSNSLNNIVTINEVGNNRVEVSASNTAATRDWPNGWGGGFTTYDISCAGIYYSTLTARSDVRLKNSIKDVDETAVNKYMKLRPVNYYWNEGKSSDINLQYGLIAQEVEKIFPEMVFTASDSMQTKSVNYQALHSISMKVIQSQHAEIENLKKNQKDLEDRLRKLERKLK